MINFKPSNENFDYGQFVCATLMLPNTQGFSNEMRDAISAGNILKYCIIKYINVCITQ